MAKVINGIKYYPVSDRIRFGIESMYEHARYMVECEYENLTAEEIDFWYDTAEECERLMWKDWLSGKDYGIAKKLTVEREWIRYNRCLAAGMSEAEAGKALG